MLRDSGHRRHRALVTEVSGGRHAWEAAHAMAVSARCGRVRGRRRGIIPPSLPPHAAAGSSVACMECILPPDFCQSLIPPSPSTLMPHSHIHTQLGSELIRNIYVACNASVMGSVEACFNRCGSDMCGPALMVEVDGLFNSNVTSPVTTATSLRLESWTILMAPHRYGVWTLPEAPQWCHHYHHHHHPLPHKPRFHTRQASPPGAST